MIRKWLAVLWFAIASTSAAAADRIERVEPASWWVGMKDDRLQLLVHGDRVAQCGQQSPGDRRHYRRGAVTLVTLPARHASARRGACRETCGPHHTLAYARAEGLSLSTARV